MEHYAVVKNNDVHVAMWNDACNMCEEKRNSYSVYSRKCLLNPKYMFIRHSFSVNILFYLCIQKVAGKSCSTLMISELWACFCSWILPPHLSALLCITRNYIYLYPFFLCFKICSTLEELLQDEVVEGGEKLGVFPPLTVCWAMCQQ